MKKFKNLKEYRAYRNRKSKEYYHRIKKDPIKYEILKEKRRKYERGRYRRMMEELKARG